MLGHDVFVLAVSEWGLRQWTFVGACVADVGLGVMAWRITRKRR